MGLKLFVGLRLDIEVLSCQSGVWRKQITFDPGSTRSYSWDELNGLGYIAAINWPHQVVFSIPFGTSANKRFVTISSVAQSAYANGNTSAAGTSVSISVNGQVCGKASYVVATPQAGIRSSTACTFEIPINSTPTVVIKHAADVPVTYLSVDSPTAPMVTFVTSSY